MDCYALHCIRLPREAFAEHMSRSGCMLKRKRGGRLVWEKWSLLVAVRVHRLADAVPQDLAHVLEEYDTNTDRVSVNQQVVREGLTVRSPARSCSWCPPR